jgi:hypothetical protein
MVIPKNVGSYCVTSHGFGHLDSLFPVFSRDPGRMHLAGDDLEGLAIQQEILVAEYKGVWFKLRPDCEGKKQKQYGGPFFAVHSCNVLFFGVLIFL